MTFARTASFSTITTLGLALFLLALPAAASHRDDDRRSDRRYSDSRAPSADQLAKRFERAVADVYKTAADMRGRRSWQHRYTVSRLHALDQQARAFRQQLRREGVRDRDTVREFRELERAFHTAQRHVPSLKHRRGIQRDFERVATLFERLDQQLAFHERRRGYDRYGFRSHGRDRHVAWWMRW